MSSDLADTPPAWVPHLSAKGSIATRLAEAIAADVKSGRLIPGARLPTQRAMADILGVTPGTVNRGYALAERAGLVSAEVGRGTFVTPTGAGGIHDASLERDAASRIEMGINYPAGGDAEAALRDALARLGRRDSLAGMLALEPYAGRLAHRVAGVRWLRQLGLTATADDVLLTTGVQHGLAAALGTLTVPGDVVLTESLTSPGIKALAATNHLRLVAVAGDTDGLIPEALTSACRATAARVLYTMPTLHTPTTTTMPDERRRAIAEVIGELGVTAIEDDPWGFLSAGRLTPLRTFAPDAVVYLTSFSKCLAPGIRVGYAVAPPPLRRALTASIGALTWAAPLMGEVVSQWVEDGTVASIAAQRSRLAEDRMRLAEGILGPAFETPGIPAFHIWVPLPEPWRVDDFVARAAAHGVTLASPDFFVPGRAPTPHSIRLCLGTEARLERVVEGLHIIARMLRTGPAGYSIPVA
jgi:DNA-binding transcriptional MocR family regulator